MRMTSPEPRGQRATEHTHRAPGIPDASQLWCFHKGNYVGVYGSYRKLRCARTCVYVKQSRVCYAPIFAIESVGDDQFSRVDGA